MEKPEIERVVIDDKKEIIEFEAQKLVKPSGTSGHIVLPKKLIGKHVKIIYKKEKGGKIK